MDLDFRFFVLYFGKEYYVEVDFEILRKVEFDGG